MHWAKAAAAIALLPLGASAAPTPLYVIAPTGDALVRLDPLDGRIITAAPLGGGARLSIRGYSAFDGARLWLRDPLDAARVRSFDPASGLEMPGAYIVPTASGTPSSLAVGPTTTVHLFNATGELLIAARAGSGTRMIEPDLLPGEQAASDLSFAGDESSILLATTAQRIVQVDLSDGAILTSATLAYVPAALSFDLAASEVYLAPETGDRIDVIAWPSGALLRTFPAHVATLSTRSIPANAWDYAPEPPWEDANTDGIADWWRDSFIGTEVPLDVYSDGTVDMKDAVLLGRRLSDGSLCPRWDLDLNGNVEAHDAELLLEFTTTLPRGRVLLPALAE